MHLSCRVHTLFYIDWIDWVLLLVLLLLGKSDGPHPSFRHRKYVLVLGKWPWKNLAGCFNFACNLLYSRFRANHLIAGVSLKDLENSAKLSFLVLNTSKVTLIMKLAHWNEMTSLQFCDSNARHWQKRRVIPSIFWVVPVYVNVQFRWLNAIERKPDCLCYSHSEKIRTAHKEVTEIPDRNLVRLHPKMSWWGLNYEADNNK